jgi:triacylglycerol lipase
MSLWDWIVDYALLVWLQVGSWLRPQPKLSFDSQKHVIIFIGGLYERWSALDFLAGRFRKAGYQAIGLPELKHNREHVAVLAARVADFIEKHDLHQVIIIGHSKGGLVGEYILRYHNTKGRVELVVGVTTPWQGTAMGKYFPFRALQELSPDSGLMRTLAASHASDANIAAISIEVDNHILKAPLTHPRATNIVVPIKGHTRVLFTRHLFEALFQIIQKHANREA